MHSKDSDSEILATQLSSTQIFLISLKKIIEILKTGHFSTILHISGQLMTRRLCGENVADREGEDLMYLAPFNFRAL